MSEPRISRRPVFLVVLAALIFVECAMLSVIAVVLIVDLLTSKPDSYASAIALLILDLLAAVWLAVVARNTLRGRSWIRGAIVTWQVLQIAVGVESFQPPFGRADVGWLLLTPAILVLALLFTPSVIAATRRQQAPDV